MADILQFRKVLNIISIPSDIFFIQFKQSSYIQNASHRF